MCPHRLGAGGDAAGGGAAGEACPGWCVWFSEMNLVTVAASSFVTRSLLTSTCVGRCCWGPLRMMLRQSHTGRKAGSRSGTADQEEAPISCPGRRLEAQASILMHPVQLRCHALCLPEPCPRLTSTT